MKKIILAVILLVTSLFFQEGYAQQDAQYTQYMYNTLSINPAYAGSRDALSILGLYRSQWVGLPGAPKTLTFSGHSPVGSNVGLGLNIIRDEIFITDETYIDVDFSYTLNVGDDKKLAFGVKGGGHLLNIDFTKANEFQSGDNLADAQPNIDNKFSPQFGLGVFYYTSKFYLGASAPNFLETEHFDESSADNNSSATAKEKINFYAISGYTFDVNYDLKFKPAVLLKLVEGAPAQVDASANFLLKDKFSIGAAYRWSAAVSLLAGFQVNDQLMIGAAYDRETTDLQRYNDGSFEIFLRFEFIKERGRMISPRFF